MIGCRRWFPVLIVPLLLGGPVAAIAHPATERYIPIGESPGLSRRETYIGRIRSVDESAHQLMVESEQGERQTIQVTPASDMWIDRSGRGRVNLDATFEDCRPGRRIEARLHEGSLEADWIKIEAR